MDRTTSIRWRSSLITRLAFLWALLIAAIVALFGFLTYRANTDSLVEANRKSLQHDIEIVPLKLQSAVSAVLRDIVYFSTSATVRKVVSTGGVRDEWKELVEDDFRALLSGKKSYFQVRIIGLADEGRELVRVDNNAGRIEVMPRERMQQKGDRDYFLAGLRLQPGEVYLSEINLNQDFGRISEPHIPTLRAVVQLPDESGAVFALLVINVDLRDVFAELQTLVGGHTQLFLVNSAGDYLVHPDPARTFASDLHTGFSFLHDFPDASQINPDSSSWLRGIADGELMLCSRSLLAPGTNREAYVAVALPADELLRGLHEARNRTLRFTGLVVLCAIAFLILAARPTARRLHRVTDAISRYDAGAPVELVLPPGNDEVSVLAEKFAAMAEKVRAQVQSIDAARVEAEEATRAKEEFLAVMSHEIRTPMNAVIGLLRALERNKPAPHQEPMLKSLGIAARNLMSLLNDALDFTKLKAGRIEFEHSDFSLVEMLSNLALTHRSIAMQKGLDLDLDLAPELPDGVRGDAVRLGQILNNLVSNALKFTDHGRVCIKAEPASEGRVRFEIEDTGIGIAPDNLDQIFKPFVQARGLDARKFDGSGLGLSITRGLVELQGGTLTVASTPGKGSCFTVTLPFAAVDHAIPLAHGGTAVPDFSGCRVLYVEDVASNREVMAATLDGSGIAISNAETGAQALALLRGGAFDLALLDVQLPDTTGPELARVIRREWPALPMIAVTAQVAASATAECRDAGMAGVVFKPIEPRQLFEEMSRHLRAKPGGFSTAKIESIFGGDPVRLRSLFATLVEEFRGHRRALESAFAAEDADAIHRIRHKAHTAIEQLDLAELRRVFDEVAAGNTALRPRCLDLLAEAARFLATKAGE